MLLKQLLGFITRHSIKPDVVLQHSFYIYIYIYILLVTSVMGVINPFFAGSSVINWLESWILTLLVTNTRYYVCYISAWHR